MSVAQVADSAAYAAKVADGYGAAAARYRSIILADSPVAYWRLDDTGATAADATGNGRTGTLSGGVTESAPGAIAGDPDTAMIFDGVSGHVSRAYDAALNPVAFSIEAWIQFAANPPASGAIVIDSINTGAAKRGYRLLVSTAGKPQLQVGNGTTLPSTAPQTALSLNAWHHLAATNDGVTSILYVDGQRVTSVAAAYLPNVSFAFTIGCNSGQLGQFFAGSIDEAAVFNYALSDTQVLNHYNAGVEKVAALATVRDQAA